MVATFDGDELTEPVFSVHTDETAPQGLVMHPTKKHLVCIFSGDVAVYDVIAGATLAENEESKAPSDAPITLKPRDEDADGVVKRVVIASVDIKCAAFNGEGDLLAVGLETGEVQLCAWPELSVTKTLGKHTDAVTGVAFSPDGKYVLTTSSEPCNKPERGAAVWSVEKGERVRTLSDPSIPANARGASFRFAGFAPEDSGVAYTGLNMGGEGYVVKWNTETWTVAMKCRVTREPVSAMSMAPDGSTLAVGNSEGHVVVVDGASLGVNGVDKGAHMIFVTTMAHNADGSVVLSGSADASACATRVNKSRGLGAVTLVMLLLVALALVWLYLRLGAVTGALSGGGGGGSAEGIDLMAGLSMEEIAAAADVAAERARVGSVGEFAAAAAGGRDAHEL